jgi:hypothetical protein
MARQVERVVLYDDFHTEGRRFVRVILLWLSALFFAVAIFFSACLWARSQARGPVTVVIPAESGGK